MKNLITLIAVLSFGVLSGQWVKTYGGSELDEATSVQQTSDGGYIIAGTTKSYGAGDKDFYLIKTNENGDTTWTKTYGGAETDECQSVKQTTDGGYIIAGTTNSFVAGDKDYYLIKTNENGDTIWSKTFDNSKYDNAFSTLQTTDGGFVIVGYTQQTGNSSYDVYLIKTDASGDTIWTKTYGGTQSEFPHYVNQTSDGGYIITGSTFSNTLGSQDVYLVKTDEYGDTLWTKAYGGTGSDVAEHVQQTPDGGYIIAGYTESFGTGSYDAYLLKTDSLGDTTWTKTYGGVDFDKATSVQQTTDGGYIIAGMTKSYGAGNMDVYVIKTNENGDTLWTKTYGGNNYDLASYLKQTSDGGYVIAGLTASFGNGNYDFYLIKTDINGNTIQTQNSINDIKDIKDMYPNPFTTYTTIKLPLELHILTIYDIVGNKVREEQVLGTTVIERGGLTKGIYIIKAKSETQTLKGKVLVE